MAFRIQIRRDTSTNWAVNNPVLLEGEFGYETDTTYMKIGDGTTPWNSLSYWSLGATGGTGATGGFIEIQENGTIITSESYVVNFVGDFNVSATSPYSVDVQYEGTPGPTGPTGPALASPYTPYFSVTAALLSGSFNSFVSSKGPDNEPLTGPNWNYSFSNIGNNLTITHNSGTKPLGLATHAHNGSNVFVKNPNFANSSGFALSYNSACTEFTVYGVNATNTGADANGEVEIIWTFGATSAVIQ